MVVDLDRLQQDAFERSQSRKKVCVFGRAGSVKSISLIGAIAQSRRVYGQYRVAVLAWTNLAAKYIEGHTLLQFLRVGNAEVSKEVGLQSASRNVFVRDEIKATGGNDELPQITTRWVTIFEYA